MEFHEIASVFPMLTEDDLAALAQDIDKHGQRHPVVLFEGKILDGRNRFLACEMECIEPKTVDFDGGWHDAVAYVTSENLRRRHLDASQRAMVADKLANLEHGQRADLADAQICASSQAEAAEQLNVSRRLVQQARQVRTQGVPELTKLVEQGAVSIGAAAELSKLPEAEQQNVLKGGPLAAKKAAAELRARPLPQRVPESPGARNARRSQSAGHAVNDIMMMVRTLESIVKASARGDVPLNADQQNIMVLGLDRLVAAADWLRGLVNGTGGLTDEDLAAWLTEEEK